MKSSHPLIVAPSLLAADFGHLAEEITDVVDCGADWLHVDVMDGRFVPPITFGDNMIKLAKMVCHCFLDVHLMVKDPLQHLRTFKEAGANRFTIHYEACQDLHEALTCIKESGMHVGLAVNPETEVEVTFDYLSQIDLLLIMTVNPGWGGQPFMEECLPKINSARKEIVRQHLGVMVEVDGGINADSAKRCREAGANVFVAGSAIFKAADRAEAIRQIRGV